MFDNAHTNKIKSNIVFVILNRFTKFDHVSMIDITELERFVR